MKILTRKQQDSIIKDIAYLAAMAYPEAKNRDGKDLLNRLAKDISINIGGQDAFLDLQVDFLKHLKRFGYED